VARKYSNAFYLDVLCRGFRSGQFARRFEDYPLETRDEMLRRSQLDDDERPALACYWSSPSWVLLTTQRVIEASEASVLAAAWSEMRSLRLPSGVVIKGGLGVTRGSIVVVLKGDREMQFEIETGAPFLGFMKALTYCIRIGNQA